MGGETVTVLQNPFSNSGYRFTGWNTAADGSGEGYSPGATFEMPNNVESLTLYAQWAPEEDPYVPQTPTPTLPVEVIPVIPATGDASGNGPTGGILICAVLLGALAGIARKRRAR